MKEIVFTEADIQRAIAEGIFDKHNNITASNPAQIIRFFEVLTKEKIRDVKNKAAEITLFVGHHLAPITPDEAHNKIMNL